MARHRHPALTPLFVFLTYWGMGYTWIAQALLFYVLIQLQIDFIPQSPLLLQAMLAPLISWILCIGLKALFRRRRPAQVLTNFAAIAHFPKDDSFPSGHAAAAFALFPPLAWAGHVLTPWVFPWALLVSFSRFYLGVHFPSDLFGGAIVGTMVGCLWTMRFF